MAKKKAGKYLGIIAVCTIICTLSFWALYSGIAFGKFEPVEPYVTGAPESLNNIIITSEGSNLKGEMGSGASPCAKEVPPRRIRDIRSAVCGRCNESRLPAEQSSLLHPASCEFQGSLLQLPEC